MVNKHSRSLVLITDAIVIISCMFFKAIAKFMIDSLPDCIFSPLGIKCPACGGTRCVYYFFGGKFAKSFEMNPFFFIMIFYAALFLIFLNLFIVFKISSAEKPMRFMIDYRTIIFIVVGFVVFGIVRNFI